MTDDDVGKVARLKPNPFPGPPGRGRSEPAAPSGDGGKQQVIQVATRCATLDEFVEKFAAFAWEGSLVLPAAAALPVGTQGRFVVLLRDQSVAMRGRCRVTEAKPTPVSPRNPAVKRVMMRVALLEMDDASRAVHKRLIALRSAPVPLPIPPEPSETTQIEPARGGTAPGAATASPPPVAARPAPAAPPPAAMPPAAAPPPAAAALAPPILPVKAPPPAPPVHLNRTMIGVGIAPIAPSARPPSPAPAAPAPPVAPPALASPGLTPAVPGAPRVPTPARVETRVPGAPDQLPANPLAQFDAEDVESFIECRLLETDADVPMDVAGPSPDESVGVATEVYVKPREKLALHLRRLARKLPPRFQQPALRAVPYAPYIAVAVICIVVGLVIGRTGRRTPPAPPPIVAAAPAPAPAPPAPDPQPPAPEPVAVQEAPKPAVPTPPTRTERRAPAPKPVAEAPEPAAEAERPARAEKPAAAAKPEPIAAAERPARAEKPAPRPAPTAAPATGNCTARIVTEPKDAKVIWGGAMIGRSPIDSARVPCGPATVTIERERWQPVTVDVDPQAGTAADVHERLHRPRATLSITSTPPGARVVINRVAAGAAPKEVDVQRFEKLQIKASLKGYQPWTKTVYLRDADANLDITLVPRK